jgi:hypothetical protein
MADNGKPDPGPAAKRNLGVGVAFCGVGAAFMALGATGQTAMTGVGAAFLALGVIFFVRSSRAGKDGGEGGS